MLNPKPTNYQACHCYIGCFNEIAKKMYLLNVKNSDKKGLKFLKISRNPFDKKYELTFTLLSCTNENTLLRCSYTFTDTKMHERDMNYY